MLSTKMKICQVMCIRQLHQLSGTPPFSHSFINVNVSVNVEFKVTLYEQVRYRGILQY